MNIKVSKDKFDLGKEAGKKAAQIIRYSLQTKGEANIILVIGMSQFETLQQLIAEEGIDWSKVRMFHLDEYIGLPESSPASFRKYLRERFINRLPALREVYLINGEAENPEEECKRLGDIIRRYPIDLAFVGIGENGHLAFNDPPADFDIENPYIVVNLDTVCRTQQLGEGWFKTIDDVPTQAISMSIKQMLLSKYIICAVPDQRKAQAVMNCLTKEVSNLHPASILQIHPACYFYLDSQSASLISNTSEITNL